ncbi:MAG TPA: TonB-dependent receptor [Thermoanaerobaculia bacterium]|nr:TonB-dependent receptor [Thermoanaerobaculia bacterium]
MKRLVRGFTLFVLLGLIGGAAFGQGTTGSLVGTVTAEGNALPGVTVSVASPALQGTRTVVTGEAGGYAFPSLPPGDYTVTFELSGMQTVTKKLRVNLTQTSRGDADLRPSALTEAITVTASAPAALETTEVSTNFSSETIAELPTLNRTIATAALIAPGVNDAGPNKQVVISGAQSFDNLFLVNGVVVNENLRGQPHNLFIEDAIQETTVISGGAISAEYGRFTGGVVSTITKSGGNEFSGSFRDSFRNDDWQSKTDFPGEADHIDDINSVYEATLGGRILRDRLWFFVAGRDEESSTSAETVVTRIPFTQGVEERRLEGKLTGNIGKHSLVGSVLDVNRKETNYRFGNVVDLASLTPRELPNSIRGLHYNGVFTDNLLVEAQYSEMDFAFVGGGATSRDRIEGTLLRDTATSNRGWSPTFCGVCRDKERNNKSAQLKGSYFLSSNRFGQHNLTAGWDDFHQLRVEDNYQSGSNYRLWGDFIVVGTDVYFRANPTNSQVAYHPLLEESKGSDFAVSSFFVNDKWDLNNNFNFNIGLRYDRASGKNQSKVKTVDDTAFSPRLGVIYDPTGNGRHRFSASYSKFASKVDQGAGDATSQGGRYGSYYWDYRGPAINPVGTPVSELVPTAEVIRRMFEWFDAQGGINNTALLNAISIPGFTSRIGDNLTAPSMDEYSIGYGVQITPRAYFRADFIHRDWKDFYVLRRDLTTGKVALPAPSTASVDQGVIETGTGDLERTYDGIQTQGSWRISDRFSLGGNYTWSKLRGNVEGEQFNNATVLAGCNGTASVPGTDSGVCAPEYQAFEQNHPVGYLAGDMRHRASIWLQYDLPTPVGRFNFSLLERYHSGLPYSAAAAIDIRQSAALPNGIANPGYVTPPSRVWYYFGERGEFRADDVTSTNFALNWESPSFRGARAFVQTDIINVFNEQAVEYPATARGNVIDQTVFVRRTQASLTAFNPFTTAPVEGTHYRYSPTFGQPTNREAYQDPREYRISVGVRF